MQAAAVKWLQVENTTKCNAWCPGCGRNKDGYELRDDLVVEDLSVERFQQVLDQLPNLHTVQFCGTYGDAMAAQDPRAYIDLALQRVGRVQIHTHGGIRNESWWHELGQLLGSEHSVWFAIDGLKGVHEIYRQGTDYNKTIANAQAFIEGGGSATWQFIPWAHNEAQIMDCLRLSQELGFKQFKLVTSVRKDFQGRHWQTGQPIHFRAWSRDSTANKYEQPNRTVTAEDCRHLTEPSVYLNASGKISPCCYFNQYRAVDALDQLPDIAVELATAVNQQCLHSCGTCATIDTYDDN